MTLGDSQQAPEPLLCPDLIDLIYLIDQLNLECLDESAHPLGAICRGG
jgi:hypothetical protein